VSVTCGKSNGKFSTTENDAKMGVLLSQAGHVLSNLGGGGGSLMGYAVSFSGRLPQFRHKYVLVALYVTDDRSRATTITPNNTLFIDKS
jgi:hypothetical protein